MRDRVAAERMMRRSVLCLGLFVCATACGRHSSARYARLPGVEVKSPTTEAIVPGTIQPLLASQIVCPGAAPRIPPKIDPCQHVATGNPAVDSRRRIYWPADKAIASARFPILMHYRD